VPTLKVESRLLRLGDANKFYFKHSEKTAVSSECNILSMRQKALISSPFQGVHKVRTLEASGRFLKSAASQSPKKMRHLDKSVEWFWRQSQTLQAVDRRWGLLWSEYVEQGVLKWRTKKCKKCFKQL